ncbi:g11657 [Coccomyxa elongata]
MLLLPPNFLKQEDKAVEFLSGIFQFLGGAAVLIGGFAASSLAYHPSRHAAISWLIPVYVAPMIGAYILTIAYIFRAVVAANRDYAERMYNWETSGPCRGPKPRLRWFAFQPKNVLWWGGLFLSLGGVMFDFATTARLAGQFWTVHYTITESLILEKIAPAVAGLLFLVGSGCYIAKEVGWMVSKGAMCPPTRKDWKSPKFWINFCTFWGSMMYFYGAFLVIMYKTISPRTFRLCQAIGYGVGSLTLMVGGILMIVKMAVREDDPEVALHQKVENDDMEAINSKLLAMAEVLGHSRDKLSQPQPESSIEPPSNPGPSRYMLAGP